VGGGSIRTRGSEQPRGDYQKPSLSSKLKVGLRIHRRVPGRGDPENFLRSEHINKRIHTLRGRRAEAVFGAWQPGCTLGGEKKQYALEGSRKARKAFDVLKVKPGKKIKKPKVQEKDAL